MDEPEARITRLEHDLAIVREQGATKVDLAELKAELAAKLAMVKADILVRLAEVDGGLRTEMAGVRTEMAGVRTEMAGLRASFEQSNGRLFRWIVLVVFLGQLTPVLFRHVGV